MKAIKTIIIVAVSAGFMLGLASCTKHTCPTYSKANTPTETKV